MLLSRSIDDDTKRCRYDGNSPTENTLINTKDSGHEGTTSIISIKQRLFVMLACIYIHCAWNCLAVSLGIIYVQLVESLNASRADAALIQSVYMGTSLGGGVLFAKMLDRYNPGNCVILASLIGTASAVGGSFAKSIVTLIVLLGVVLGIVMSCNVLAGFVTVANVFTTNRKFALAILTIGQTIGQITVPFVTYALIENYNWNGALLVLSGITTLNCIPCGLVIMFALKSTRGVKAKEDKARATPIIRDPLIYFFVFSYFIFLLFALVEQWFAADLAVMKGYTFEEGSRLLSVNGGAGFTGRMLGAMLVRKYKDVGTGVYLISACTFWSIIHYAIYLAPKYWTLVLFMVFRGLSAGMVASTIPVMQLELGGLENFAITVAVCDLAGGTGEIIGGYIGGLTVEITGNYQQLFFLASMSAVYSAVSHVIVYCVLSRRKRIASLMFYNAL